MTQPPPRPSTSPPAAFPTKEPPLPTPIIRTLTASSADSPTASHQRSGRFSSTATVIACIGFTHTGRKTFLGTLLRSAFVNSTLSQPPFVTDVIELDGISAN